MTALSPHAIDALGALTLEPLWKRKGFFVPASRIGSDNTALFAARMMAVLCRRGLISIRFRHNPRRIEARLTGTGREVAARLLARQAEEMIEEAA